MEQKMKPANILVIDDDLGVRESLKMILKEKYSISATSNIEEALNSLNNIKPEMIFLDIKMPRANGLDFLKQMRSANSTIPIIMITAFPSTQTTITALRNGAFDYIIKPFQPSEILAVTEKALNHHLELSEKDRLVENLRTAVQQNFFSTAEALLLAIDAKDSYTAGHSKRVSQLFALVSEELGINKSRIEVLRYGAFLHDIGKIGVGDVVLAKPSFLTNDEFVIMKRHSEIGYKILEPIDFLKECLPIVRHHHEWYNGNGYPDGLKGPEIPFEASILSIVDAYDALTTDRHYHKKYSHQKACEIIREGICIQFVPDLTEKILTIIDRYRELCSRNEDGEKS
ncbi:MAG: two-component system response regulator [Candidatus Brocadia sp. AMX2]|uniref:Response regulator containing a CheY-like receiver domain and an HD-GYP domain n=1 Tax=Candidatus Brocadia sinica JPN1 TaxID=1197129 RepID=A0ABQ0JT20_9BACT|nr:MULTISPECIES: HD domain-containing phosphohydrolase [Brocadia]KXK30584.1 MAG: two-component response regulator [Candidatus Brocadia sinica]MBC6931636.1 two-component system response regulator [Candidatus Brocadia sp.]MBL1168999.1 two-component system response regulator [Candidatus Brocadia sp. AMX1]NOG43433.1 response regulator [Planctomycetota bacterium]KAA0245234.1 MAG: two-component system response regulator [Candidatus Brocadia sp. AMX2]